MRALSPDISAEYVKETMRHFFMVEFNFDSTYRYNDTEEKIYDSSNNLFLPRSFKFDDLSTLSGLAVTQLDIDIDNTDQVISSILLNEDTRNNIVKLYIGVVAQTDFIGAEWEAGSSWEVGTMWSGDYTSTKIVTQEFFRGILGGWVLSEDNRARITIKNELVLWSKKTLRTQSSSCPWTFKGIECGYGGIETWCDQSYDRCYVLHMTDNFGGFRFLPSIMEREVWWGRQQSL
jgi:hypothetical protein